MTDSRRLRIALFSDSALPILNGVSISIRSLVHELRSRGHSVTIFTAAHFKYRDPDPNTIRFPAIETPWTKGYPLAFPPFYPMLREFRKHEFDIVHTHTPFTIGYVGLRWAESHDLPIVSTYHTLYDRYAHYIPLPRRYIRFKIAKHTSFYYNNVDHVITPSEASMKWLQRHSVTTPVTVIPTGVSNGAMIDRAEARMSLGVAPDERILLYVGRIAQEKNLGTLFESVAMAFREDPRLRLWLVGDGPYREEARAMVRALGIGDRVRFVGFVPREEVDPYYAAADLFVFTSVTETQGLVVQEAMAFGLPAIVAVGGGASASVEHGVNGFIVKNEAQEVTTHIQRVLADDHLYARLSEAARDSVRGYTTADMGGRVLDLYRHVIGERAVRREQGVLAGL
ncbi:MAG: glycosyltransferase family 4 protein [Methanoregulaceae archaeon]|nr:glycosyltransferase family 4 protein [Methanoregulaceae archaeon]